MNVCKATIIKRTIANIETDIVGLYEELGKTRINDIDEAHRIRVAIIYAEEIIEDLKQGIEP